MRSRLIALILALCAGLAQAADGTCEGRATEKKLSGAARTSFVKKCVKDLAQTDCTQAAMEKKLKGAARTSFVKKCEKDRAAATPLSSASSAASGAR